MLPSSVSTFLLSIVGVVFVDLILSGDNALVVGAVASRISNRRQRWIALIFGGVLAILLRVTFTISTTFLLGIPYLQAVGGLLVCFIATRLVIEDQPSPSGPTTETGAQTQDQEELPALARRFSSWIGQKIEHRVSSRRWSFLLAVMTIAVADLTMSLDNIVAIGGLAHGQVLIIVVGLVLSIILLLLGSAFVSELVGRLPGLILVTGVILAWIAADLVWNDLQHLVHNSFLYQVLLHALLIGVVLAFAFSKRLRSSHFQQPTTLSPRTEPQYIRPEPKRQSLSAPHLPTNQRKSAPLNTTEPLSNQRKSVPLNEIEQL